MMLSSDFLSTGRPFKTCNVSPMMGTLKSTGAPVQCHGLPMGSPTMLFSANKNIGQYTMKPCGCHVIMYLLDWSTSSAPLSDFTVTPMSHDHKRSTLVTSNGNHNGPTGFP